MIYRLIVCLIFILEFSHAQDVYNIDAMYPVHDLMPQLLITEDKNDRLQPEMILSDTTIKFSKRAAYGRYLKPHLTYWAKIHVHTQNPLKDWTLQFEDKHIGPPAWTKSNGLVDVYAYRNDALLFHKKTGVEYKREERDIKANWVLNKVSLSELPVNQMVTLIIKIRGNQMGYPAYFNLTARSPNQPFYHQIFQFNNSFNIFMFGVSFIIFLYHLLLYLYLRERVYLWFTLWLSFCVLTQAMTIGIVIGSFTKFRYPLLMLITHGIFYSFWFFGRSFIDSKQKYPKLDKFIIGLPLISIIAILISGLYAIVFDVKPIFLDIGVHFKVLNVYSILSLVLSVILVVKKDTLTKFFGFGSIVASSFLIAGTLWSLGIIKPIKNFTDPYATGMFLQIIIYSFGIVYRQRQISLKTQQEKLEAQATYAEMKRVKDLDEIKTRFFANISHEFRTPLALITGPLKRALKTEGDEDTIRLRKKHFELIKNNTSRLQNLVDQLLELSKIESGNIHLSLKQGGIISLLRSLIFSFESLAERQNISLNTNLPKAADFAFYDKDKLEKIVTNILSNAFKYTSENGSVTVTADYTEDHLTLEITDTGKGIATEDMMRIFERFYRVEGSEEKGSGIGLALTKELVELQNGTISVNSTKGKGTTFKIRLPISLKYLPKDISIISTSNNEDSLVHEDLESQPSNISRPLPSENKTLPVALVVEDNTDLQYYIADILKNHYILLIAKDGYQGERMAFEHIPDIIISDVMMPKKDGYQLCNSLKSNAKTSHIPIIMLTAKAGKRNKLEGLTQGADAYITKPFDDEELLLLMKNLVESRKKLWAHFKALDMLLVNDIDVVSIDDKFLQDVFKSIKANLDNDTFGVDDISRQVGFSRSQLHRKLKALSGKSPNQLITEVRLNEAYRLLRLKSGSVSQIAYAVGYSNLSYFTKSFKEKFGRVPSKILQQKH